MCMCVGVLCLCIVCIFHGQHVIFNAGFKDIVKQFLIRCKYDHGHIIGQKYAYVYAPYKETYTHSCGSQEKQVGSRQAHLPVKSSKGGFATVLYIYYIL